MFWQLWDWPKTVSDRNCHYFWHCWECLPFLFTGKFRYHFRDLTSGVSGTFPANSVISTTKSQHYCSIKTTPVPTMQQQHSTFYKKVTSSLSPIPHTHLTWPRATSFFFLKLRNNSGGSRLQAWKMLECSPRAPFLTYFNQPGLEPWTVGLKGWQSASELRGDTSKSWNR